MKIIVLLVILITSLARPCAHGASAGESGGDAGPPVVLMETSLGRIRIQLEPERAPVTVKNFLDYVESGFYDNTIFHRVVKNFVIQGGAYSTDLQRKPTGAPIGNEAANGLKNRRGAIAMARGVAVDSASAEFFINVADNPILNHQDDSIQGYGYAVFGRVIEGMTVVDRIQRVETAKRKGLRKVPKVPVVIKSVRVIR
ncbi:peptidylprolyl isomerase [Geobacter argillaceus]|uniref:Peptidyl-prolyl cis-trans isomerase n=1 Tax=Geobacter argillaceus TaxID=345631 RepID=A0A562WQS7_9BACT|nr:peptidylprolyl isomerase [Geobacter argillaceus]TWJ32703.1 peptidyl-prolyl cis-trans isomerase A (cyclophilin A)/peptidyl-prolyl cis-trans isomerase B (cyclophilin B) [Geobacter argillaceus]